MYGEFNSFHQSIANTRVLVFFYYLLSKINFIIKKIIKLPIINVNNEIIEIIFSKNQLKSSNALALVNSKRIILGLDKIDSIKKNDFLMSNYKILFLSMILSDQIYNTLKRVNNDPLLKKNNFRIIKLLVIERVFKSLNHQKIKTVINYNDHSPYNVITFDFFKKIKKKIVYCQHAPVSNKFPKLYHDINLLFSNDSKDKYGHIAKTEKDVLIIGDIRFWDLPKTNKINNKIKETILICTNKIDCLDSIKKCAEFFINQNFKVILRKHPADNSTIHLSDEIIISSNSNIFDDLSLCDIVVTNESAVPLESIYLNKLTYIYRFNQKKGTALVFDNYSFMKIGLITRDFTSLGKLLSSIKKKEITFSKEKLDYFIGPVSEKEKIRTKLITRLYS